MTTYHIEKLTYAYKGSRRPSNDGISFSIPQGEIVGILGPNGAGKTTLIRQMLGLLKPGSGTISIFGENVLQRPELIGQYVSYLSQEGLGPGFGHLKAFEAVAFTGMLRDLSKSESLEQARFWLESLGISSLRDSLIKKLSGGEKRLVSLAAALIGTRPILVMDEPTNDLDPEARKRVWNLLRHLRQSRNATLIVVTHNILEADQMVDRVAILEAGSLLAYEGISLFRRRVSGLRMDILPSPHFSEDLCRDLARYGAVSRKEETLCVFPSNENSEAFLRFLEDKRKEGLVHEWRMRTPNLEDAYFSLTRHQPEFSA